jgi:hypothetical protein
MLGPTRRFDVGPTLALGTLVSERRPKQVIAISKTISQFHADAHSSASMIRPVLIQSLRASALDSAHDVGGRPETFATGHDSCRGVSDEPIYACATASSIGALHCPSRHFRGRLVRAYADVVRSRGRASGACWHARSRAGDAYAIGGLDPSLPNIAASPRWPSSGSARMPALARRCPD